MRVEITLCTPVGKRLNGAADALFRILDREGIKERRVVDRNDAGFARVYVEIPETLYKEIQGLEQVICLRADAGSRA